MRLRSNQFLPKITQSFEVHNYEEQIFEESPVSFRFYSLNGQYPEGFKMENYFTFSLILGNIWLEESVKDIPPVLCKEEYGDINNKFKEDEYCFPKNMKVFSKQRPGEGAFESSLNIQVKRCTGNQQCEFDYKTKKIVESIRDQYFQLNTLDIFTARTYLLKSDVVYDDGFLISNYGKSDYIYNVEQEIWQNKYDQFVHKNPYFQEKGILFSGQYSLKLQTRQMRVEYVKITEILAQFNSLFQTFLLIGIFAKFASESKLFEQMIEVHLQYYYQKVYDIKSWNQNQHKFNFGLWKSMKHYFKNEIFPDKIQQQNKEIKTCNLLKRSKDQFKIDAYNQIFKVTKQNLDISQIYREVLQLKTYVQMLFTEEEYAAIQYCGRRPPNLQQVKYKGKEYQFAVVENHKNQLNHLEKLDLIDKNIIIRYETFQSYLRKQKLASLYNIPTSNRSSKTNFNLSTTFRQMTQQQQIQQQQSEQIRQRIQECFYDNHYKPDQKNCNQKEKTIIKYYGHEYSKEIEMENRQIEEMEKQSIDFDISSRINLNLQEDNINSKTRKLKKINSDIYPQLRNKVQSIDETNTINNSKSIDNNISSQKQQNESNSNSSYSIVVDEESQISSQISDIDEQISQDKQTIKQQK